MFMWRKFNEFLNQELWQSEPVGVWRRRLYPALRILVVMVQELLGGQLTLRAMSLVYTSLLSLVPLLAVSFSVLKAFGVHNQLEPLLLTYLEPLGEQGIELTQHILSFVDNMKVGVLGSVGVGLLLYTIISLTQKVESAFNYVWRVGTTRSLARRFSDYLSVILVGPVLVFSALGLTATLMNSGIVQSLRALPGVGVLILLAGKAVPFFLIIAAFTFIYMFVPNTRVKIRAALVGAVVSGVLWQASGMLFASFVAGSTRYTAIYSGFAILVFFMIWLYLSWFILLFGAQISYFYQHPQQIRPQREAFRLSGRLKERAGLVLMYLAADAYYQGRALWTEEALVHRLGLPGDTVDELLHFLVQRGYLLPTGEDALAYVPARDPAQMPLATLLDDLRRVEETVHVLPGSRLQLEPVNGLLAEVDAARERALAGMTLRDLVHGRAVAD